MKYVKIIDSALRDGSHAVANKFRLDDISKVTKVLDKSKVNYIEIGHGYGLGSLNKEELPKDKDMILVARENTEFSKLSTMIFPSKAKLEDLNIAIDTNIDLLRIAVQSNNTSPGIDYLKVAKENNLKVDGFMMMSHKVDSKELVQQAKKLVDNGVDSITITDSAGYMLPGEVKEKVGLISENFGKFIDIGFHSHDNLGLSVANSLTAVKYGANLIDTSLSGLGAGAGNTPTELFSTCLNRLGIKNEIDLFSLLDASKVLRSITSKYNFELQNYQDSLMIGYTGVYSTFLKSFKELSKRYNIDYKKIVLEASKYNLEPGDESKLEEIIKNLS